MPPRSRRARQQRTQQCYRLNAAQRTPVVPPGEEEMLRARSDALDGVADPLEAKKYRIVSGERICGWTRDPGPHTAHSHTAHGALPHRSPCTRCTTDLVHLTVCGAGATLPTHTSRRTSTCARRSAPARARPTTTSARGSAASSGCSTCAPRRRRRCRTPSAAASPRAPTTPQRSPPPACGCSSACRPDLSTRRAAPACAPHGSGGRASIRACWSASCSVGSACAARRWRSWTRRHAARATHAQCTAHTPCTFPRCTADSVHRVCFFVTGRRAP